MLLTKYSLVIVILLFIATSILAKDVKTFEESQRVIESAEGKAAFAREIGGKNNLDFGEKLPPGVTDDELSQLVFKKSYSQITKNAKCEFEGLAAHSWPGRPELYVGIGATNYCNASPSDDHAKIYITVFKINKPHDFEIVARNEKQFIFDYKDDALEETNAFDELVRLDHATFRIAPNKYAFGVRIANNHGYSDGFAHNQNLVLFTLNGKTITSVLNQPIYILEDLAGDWNSDGTRQHSVDEQEWMVDIIPKLHNQHFDVVMKQSRGGRKVSHLAWINGEYSLAR